jgi:transposase
MHEALILIAQAISLAHDHWRRTVGRRRPLSGKIAILLERVERLEAENALLRSRFFRIPGLRRPHYRRNERLEILWHAARYRMSVTATARAFCLTRQTILNWRAVMRRKDAWLLPPIRGLPGLVHELVHRLKREWPRWGTRRIAGQLACLGVRASRSSVQRILRRGPRSPVEPICTDAPSRVLLAKRPDHNRGRDAGFPAPPAQIPASGATAPGSYLGCWRRIADSARDGGHGVAEASGRTAG